MTDFKAGYFTMTEEQALEYAQKKLDFFKDDAELTCKEIGDGNLNYVFRIVDAKHDTSIIIKQAGPVARISDEFKLSPDRNRIESDILKLHYQFVPKHAPKTYQYDAVMNCFAMEDLSDHQILRTALLKKQKFPHFAEHITTFLAKTLLLTSDVVMEHKQKKARVQSFINPELSEITEDLVYTEPFYDCPRNEVFPPSKSFVAEHIWSDEKLALETAKLKFEFMNHTQSLIHGDLHTGSIFVTKNGTKVIDPEFAFYGPAGYDVGNIIANLTFAYVHAKYTIQDQEQKADYLAYLLNTIEDIVDLFKEKFLVLWEEHATERTAKYKGFKDYYLDSILKDTAAVTGLELCRRIIGLAHVADITSITDPDSRLNAEKLCLSAGKKFILERDTIKTGADFVTIIKEFEQVAFLEV